MSRLITSAVIVPTMAIEADTSVRVSDETWVGCRRRPSQRPQAPAQERMARISAAIWSEVISVVNLPIIRSVGRPQLQTYSVSAGESAWTRFDIEAGPALGRPESAVPKAHYIGHTSLATTGCVEVLAFAKLARLFPSWVGNPN